MTSMVLKALPVIAMVLFATACSSTGLFYDPVFAAVRTPRASNGACADDSTYVDVPLTALGAAAGRTGTCKLYMTPGDPADMEPLVAKTLDIPEPDTDQFEITFVWEAKIPGAIEPGRLNPVCGPMIEG
ncbi:MAG: hypothetical protein ABR616_01740 [Dermatophilaceae bacterium]